MLSGRRSNDDPSLAQVLAASAELVFAVVFPEAHMMDEKTRTKRTRELCQAAGIMRDTMGVRSVYIVVVVDGDDALLGGAATSRSDKDAQEQMAKDFYFIADKVATGDNSLTMWKSKRQK
jgi:hypothetical protein